MKKLSILLACLAAVFSFSSCEEDTDPRYTEPTKFELNTPAMAEQLYELTPDGTIDLSWSQPDYGFAAVAKYQVQVAIDTVAGEFQTIDAIFTTCKASVSSAQIAEAICKLRGIETEDQYVDEGARELFVRVQASLDGVESSLIHSNVIVLKKVQDYCAIQSAGYIYLVGDITGWSEPSEANAAHYEQWRLYESSTAIGSKIYSGVFDIPASGATFRFYVTLGGWGGDGALPSMGPLPNDNTSLGVEFTDGVFTGDLVPGKGSFVVPAWEGGSVKITVDLNKNTVIMEVGGVDTNDKAFIYLVGAPEGWAGPDAANADHYEPWKLYDLAGNGVYTGTFDVPADKFEFRFYTALTGWDGGASFGSKEADENVEVVFADGVYSGAAMSGKGKWNVPGWAGGKVAMEVDVNNGKVTFTQE